jgi:DNA-binding GntR family transcriptional regulator
VERPLERRILRDQIRERILARILDGTYPPGARVVESQVAHEFGTSQAPVREALRDLEGMRMIETRPHVGARVREVTTDELAQIYPVRAALEEVAGREAASRITEDALAQLEGELAAMRQAAETRDVHLQLVHDVRFHEVIVESSGNLILLDVWRSLRVEARTLISVIKTDWDLRMIAEMHRPVLAALRGGDPELAGKEMRAHIEFFGTLVRGGGSPAAP